MTRSNRSFARRFRGTIDRGLQITGGRRLSKAMFNGLSQLARRTFRRDAAGSRAGEQANPAPARSRRELLGTLGVLPALGLAAWPTKAQAAGTGPDGEIDLSPLTKTDQREFGRLRSLNLEDPQVVAKKQQMPTGKIGSLTVGRLISGSNLISMNMHARDLDYVRGLATHYNSEERIFMTLKKCEELGVNTIVLKNHNFKHFRLSKYWDEWGGQMQWLADVITTDIDKYEQLLVAHLDLGADAAYLWGGASDIWYFQKKPDNIIRAFEIMKRYDIPVGIGAHRLEPIMFCEREGLVPDFYIKTLHHDRYWSAHPPGNRRYMEMFEKESEDHAEYHDNMFCHDYEKTVEFMQDVKVPWIAFKVLAAGAIPPENGIKCAFDSGADFICLGMFDFQIEADVRLTRKFIAEAEGRKRAWV